MKITPAYLIQVWPELSAFSDVFGCCFRAPDADYSFRFFSASANALLIGDSASFACFFM